MPIKNGIEVAKEIFKHQDCHPKIIFMSADKSVKELALSLGAAFLEKPVSFNELIKKVELVFK